MRTVEGAPTWVRVLWYDPESLNLRPVGEGWLRSMTSPALAVQGLWVGAKELWRSLFLGCSQFGLLCLLVVRGSYLETPM